MEKFTLQGAHPRLRGASLAAVVLAVLFLCAGTADATPGHSILRTFSVGPGTNPRGVALDSSGDVYVYAAQTGRLLKFDAAGAPVAFSGKASYIEGNAITGTPLSPFGSNFFGGIAIDRNDGDIYLIIGEDAPIVFAPSGRYLGTVSVPNVYYCGIAVDQKSGELYLGNGNASKVDRIDVPAGEPGAATTTGELAVGLYNSCPVAATESGAVYVGYNPTFRYEASQFESSSPSPSAEYKETNADALAVDSADGSAYFSLGGSQLLKLSPAGVEEGSPFGELTTSAGLAADGDVFATDEHGGVFVFGPEQVDLPKVQTGAVSNVTRVSAAVEGTVEPDEAGGIVGCEFRYGRDSGYSEGSVPCEPAASKGKPIESPTPVTATIEGLKVGTTYHYRLFASNANGTQAGGDGEFTTPPAVAGVTTLPATEVAKTSAALNGSFEGDGNDTHYYFEYGTSTEYGKTEPVPPADAGSPTERQEVAPIRLTGLQGGTTYHFRLVAENKFGVTRGSDEIFTTAEAVTELTTEEPTEITNSSATLHGSFTADSADTHYYFEYGPTTAYGMTAPAPPGTDLGSGSGHVSVPPVTITGLQTNVTYHFRIVATNEDGRSVGGDFAFRTAGPPLVEGLATTDVTASSAELDAIVDPRDGRTTYRFEWGPTRSYGNTVPVPEGALEAGNVAVPVSAQILGLSPGVTYHFRIVATNPYGTAESEDQTFSFSPESCPNAQLRQETRSNSLPDCRAYELVTPGEAQGASIFSENGPRAGYATNPAKLAYTAAFGTFSEETGDPPNSSGDLYVSTRTATGWYQKYIGRAATETVLMGNPPTNCIPSLFQGQDPSKSQLDDQASPDLERVVNYNLGLPSVNLGLQDEPSNAPYVWETSTGRLIERWPTNLPQIPGGNAFVGIPRASADLSHFVFSSNVVFAPGGQAGGENDQLQLECNGVKPPVADIYDDDIATGNVSLASVKANGTPFAGTVLNISEEGKRILMAESSNATLGQDQPLFLRVGDSRTYDIAPGHQVKYVGSSGDGSTIYLTSKEQLTPDDHDNSVDLFAWHESEPNSLTRISVGAEGDVGNTDECNASWIEGCGIEVVNFGNFSNLHGGTGGNGFSDNSIASRTGDIYFLSPEQLAGPQGDPGQANLYLYRNQHIHFVASLEPGQYCPSPEPFETVCAGGPIGRMQVTPDGKYMAMVTNSKIGSYDNAGHGEMYLYSAESGRLTCVSCKPDGEPPTGEVYGSLNGLFLTEGGTPFFATEDALVPQDTDETRDVYEYTNGRAQLITSGLSEKVNGFNSFAGNLSPIGLVSVSANGTDVYFSTFDVLVSQDHNGAQIKIYDARTGGGFPAEREVTKCAAADECHGQTSSPPTLPPDRTSAGFGSPHKKRHHHKKKHHKGKHHKKKHHKGDGHKAHGKKHNPSSKQSGHGGQGK